MKGKPGNSVAGTLTFHVESQHLIDFAGGDMPAVLSTPWLIKWLEQTARETLRPFLDESEASVGVEVDIRHLAPAPLGSAVTCVARVIASEGTTVTFQVEAADAQELIARGFHQRAVISKARFFQRVTRKQTR